MVSSLKSGYAIGDIMFVGATSNDMPRSCINLQIIKGRLERGEEVAFINMESEMDFTKYEKYYAPETSNRN